MEVRLVLRLSNIERPVMNSRRVDYERWNTGPFLYIVRAYVSEDQNVGMPLLQEKRCQ